jgi:hypothetical protein
MSNELAPFLTHIDYVSVYTVWNPNQQQSCVIRMLLTECFPATAACGQAMFDYTHFVFSTYLLYTICKVRRSLAECIIVFIY